MTLFVDEERRDLVSRWGRYRELLSRGVDVTAAELAEIRRLAGELGITPAHVQLHRAAVAAAGELAASAGEDGAAMRARIREARRTLSSMEREHRARELRARQAIAGLEGRLFAMTAAGRGMEGLRRAFPKLLAGDLDAVPATIVHPRLSALARRLGIDAVEGTGAVVAPRR